MARTDIENLTIFTDASFCPDTNAAGGALWSRTDKIFYQTSFAVEGAQSANDAEILTACTAIDLVLGTDEYAAFFHGTSNVRIVLVTDAQSVKSALETDKHTRLRDFVLHHIHNMRQRLRLNRVLLKVNHVKGHSGQLDSRSVVNRWCDKQAGLRMRAERAFRRGAS